MDTLLTRKKKPAIKLHTPANEASARKAFNEVQVECSGLLRRISDSLNKKGTNDLSWAALGTIKHTRDLLIEVLAGVGGLTKEEIAKYPL